MRSSGAAITLGAEVGGGSISPNTIKSVSKRNHFCEPPWNDMMRQLKLVVVDQLVYKAIDCMVSVGGGGGSSTNDGRDQTSKGQPPPSTQSYCV